MNWDSFSHCVPAIIAAVFVVGWIVMLLIGKHHDVVRRRKRLPLDVRTLLK